MPSSLPVAARRRPARIAPAALLAAVVALAAVPGAGAAFTADAGALRGGHVRATVAAEDGAVCAWTLDDQAVVSGLRWSGGGGRLYVQQGVAVLAGIPVEASGEPQPFPGGGGGGGGGGGVPGPQPTSTTGADGSGTTGSSITEGETTDPATGTETGTETTSSETTTDGSTTQTPSSDTSTATDTESSTTSDTGSATPTDTATQTSGTSDPPTGDPDPTSTSDTSSTGDPATQTADSSSDAPTQSGTETAATSTDPLAGAACSGLAPPAAATDASTSPTRVVLYDVATGAARVDLARGQAVRLAAPDGWQAQAPPAGVDASAAAAFRGPPGLLVLWLAGPGTIAQDGLAATATADGPATLHLRLVRDGTDAAAVVALQDGRLGAELHVRPAEDIVVEPGDDAALDVATARTDAAIQVRTNNHGEATHVLVELDGVHGGSLDHLRVQLDGHDLAAAPFAQALAQPDAAALVEGARPRVLVPVPAGEHTLTLADEAGAIAARPVPLGGDDADVVVGAPRPLDVGDGGQDPRSVPAPPAWAIGALVMACAGLVLRRRWA